MVEEMTQKQEFHNAETILLGLLLCENENIPLAASAIKASSFEIDSHQRLYAKIIFCYDKYKAVDLIILSEASSEEEVNAFGGMDYVRSLISGVPTEARYQAYEQAVLERAVKRMMKLGAERLLSALDEDASLDKLNNLADRLKGNIEDESVVDIELASEAAMKELDATRNKGIDLAVGIPDCDLALGGVRRKLLYTVGGKTSQGKTTFAINLMYHNLITNPDCKILYNGFENLDQIPLRLASVASGHRLETYLKPHKASEDEYSRALISLGELSRWKSRLKVISCGDIGKLRSAMTSFKPDITIVDYIQRLGYKYSSGSEGSIRHAVAKATSDIQDLGLEFNSAMFCLSQFSRAPEERRASLPEIENLKESGDIENYSDIIILLWWPWRATFQDRYRPEEYKLLIRKNKMGPCLDVHCRIELDTLRIRPWVLPEAANG